MRFCNFKKSQIYFISMHSRKNYEFFGHEKIMQPWVGFEPNTM